MLCTALHDRKRVLSLTPASVTCQAFSPDGETLISGSDDMQIIFWDWQSSALNIVSCYAMSLAMTAPEADVRCRITLSWQHALLEHRGAC